MSSSGSSADEKRPTFVTDSPEQTNVAEVDSPEPSNELSLSETTENEEADFEEQEDEDAIGGVANGMVLRNGGDKHEDGED